MTLVIQTTIAGKISVWLARRGKLLARHTEPVAWHGSDRALAVVDDVLLQNNTTIRSVGKIIVVRGPGSFTAVRTGLIIANTLGTILRIPVAGIVTQHPLTDPDALRYAKMQGAKGSLIKPWYGKSPNITKAKPKQFQTRAKR